MPYNPRPSITSQARRTRPGQEEAKPMQRPPRVTGTLAPPATYEALIPFTRPQTDNAKTVKIAVGVAVGIFLLSLALKK